MLSTTIDLQSILIDLGRAYSSETSGSSIISTVQLATGPKYSVSLARNLVSSYTTGNNPVGGSDYDTLNKFSTDLRSLEEEIQNIYYNLQSSYLSTQFSKLNTFITNAYSTDIRSYLNTYPYSTTTGPVYDIHGGFAKSYLDYNGNSLIFKLAEISVSGSYTTMFHGAMNYPGVGGFTKLVANSFTGPVYNISNENISTSLYSGSYGTVFEYGSTGSVCFNFILGNSSTIRTVAYPRLVNSGFAGPTGSTQLVRINNIAFTIKSQPIMRQAGAANTLILKASSVQDNGDRDFVFKMVKNNTNYPTDSDIEQTKIITVAGAGDYSTIIGTTGNASFYRPFSVVSATGVKDGEIFEIWVQE